MCRVNSMANSMLNVRFKINAIIIAYKVLNELKWTNTKQKLKLSPSLITWLDVYVVQNRPFIGTYIYLLYTLLFPLSWLSGTSKHTRLKKIYSIVPVPYLIARCTMDQHGNWEWEVTYSAQWAAAAQHRKHFTVVCCWEDLGVVGVQQFYM